MATETSVGMALKLKMHVEVIRMFVRFPKDLVQECRGRVVLVLYGKLHRFMTNSYILLFKVVESPRSIFYRTTTWRCRIPTGDVKIYDFIFHRAIFLQIPGQDLGLAEVGGHSHKT